MSIVSVIVPTYNRSGRIRGAIDSILNQTYDEIEIIIINDGSTDGTKEVLQLYASHDSVRIFNLDSNVGRSQARNKGIHEARGEFICVLDDDDRWCATKIEKQVKLFKSLGDEYGLIYTWAVVKTNDRVTSEIKNSECGDIYPEILGSYSITPHTSYMARSTCFQDVSGYDPTFQYGEDWDITIRIAKKWKVDVVPEILTEVNNHPDNDPDSARLVHYEKLQNKYLQEFEEYPQQKRQIQANKHKMKAIISLISQEWVNGLRASCRSFINNPSLDRLLLIIISLLGPSFFNFVRERQYKLQKMGIK